MVKGFVKMAKANVPVNQSKVKEGDKLVAEAEKR